MCHVIYLWLSFLFSLFFFFLPCRMRLCVCMSAYCVLMDSYEWTCVCCMARTHFYAVYSYYSYSFLILSVRCVCVFSYSTWTVKLIRNHILWPVIIIYISFFYVRIRFGWSQIRIDSFFFWQSRIRTLLNFFHMVSLRYRWCGLRNFHLFSFFQFYIICNSMT